MFKAEWHCQTCRLCKSPTVFDLQAAGVWPGSAQGQRTETYIDEEVLEEWERLKDSLPGSSLQGFLNAKQRQSLAYGGIEASLLHDCCSC